MNQQLVDYIKKEMKKGYAEGQIKSALIKSGFSEVAVDEAFMAATGDEEPAAPTLSEAENKQEAAKEQPPAEKSKKKLNLLIAVPLVLVLKHPFISLLVRKWW